MCLTFKKFGDHYFDIPHGRNLSSVFWLIFLSSVPHMKASMEFEIPTDWMGWGVAMGSDTEGLEFLSRPCERVPLYRISWVKCQLSLPLCSASPNPLDLARKWYTWWMWCSEPGFPQGESSILGQNKKKNANMLEQFLLIKGYEEGREMAFWNGMDIAAKRIRGKTFAFSYLPPANKLSPGISACSFLMCDFPLPSLPPIGLDGFGGKVVSLYGLCGVDW